MKIAGIIAEWNPFHNGHAYLVQEAKEKYGCDYVIGVMSGDFVQRGMPAMLDKYERTRAALLCGVDLVLELPVRYATGSAEFFAGEGVHILNSLGCVTHLFFGMETLPGKPGKIGKSNLPETSQFNKSSLSEISQIDQSDLPEISRIVDILVEEPDAYKTDLQTGLKSGLSFPAAREQAIVRVLLQNKEKPTCEKTPQLEEQPTFRQALRRLRKQAAAQLPEGDPDYSFLKEPNIILALEYFKALKKTGSSILPVAITRRDKGYHNTEFPIASSDEGFASASAIRSACENQTSLPDLCKPFMPEFSAALLDIALQLGYIPDGKKFDLLMHWSLLQRAQEGFDSFADVTPDLAARINKLLFQYESYDQFVSLLKTRQITRTHVCRALLHIFLGLRKENPTAVPSYYPEYARILGFREDASPLLSAVGKSSRIRLISNNADAGNYACFLEDLHAGHLYQMLLKADIKTESEMTRSPVRV